jgi:oligopeptide/dipeptide ABC transporter ATP-binding protein
MSAFLEIQRLKKHFPVSKGIFRRHSGWLKAVDGISFAIERGKTFALVGESGCGKTTTARVILGLEDPTDGLIIYNGKSIAEAKKEELKEYRSSVQAVFQDPSSSFDPRMKVWSAICEPVEANHRLPRRRRRRMAQGALEQVGLKPEALDLYPHEFSGGQRQRLAIARALILGPTLVVLDEPVSALDVSIQAQILNLLKDLQEQLNVAYLLISHNLATIRHMSHRMGVMYMGEIVEMGDSEELYLNPLNPYTQALLSAALPSRPDAIRKAVPISGEISSSIQPPSGCRFHPRCLSATPICSEEKPPLKEVSIGHLVRCHHY